MRPEHVYVNRVGVTTWLHNYSSTSQTWSRDPFKIPRLKYVQLPKDDLARNAKSTQVLVSCPSG